MAHLVLGVIGHVDHGKTALVGALTGEDTDRLNEEKRRGISIALGFARLRAGPDLDIDLIDMPGHERFVRTMIGGATGMDGSLLVVAANEGIKPQTLEHLDIASLLGLRSVVVAVSKADLVTPERARAVAEQVLHLLRDRNMEAENPVITSAATGEGIDEVQRALSGLRGTSSTPQPAGIPFLPVDRAFTVTGSGPVVTGTLRGGRINSRDRLELLPARRTVRVRGLQVRGEPVTVATPGQRVAVNLRDISGAELKRGMALAPPGALALSEWLTLSLRSVPGAPPLNNGAPLRAFFGTGESDCRLRLLDRDRLEPGQSCLAQLRFDTPVAIPAREHVILRVPSPPRSVAGGRILEPHSRRQRRHSREVLERLADLDSLPVADMLFGEVNRAGMSGAALERLSLLSSLPRSGVAGLLESYPVVVTGSGVAVGQSAMNELVATITSLLERQIAGLSREQLLAAIPDSGSAILDEAIARLLARGTVNRHGGRVTLARPAEDRARKRREEALVSHLAAVLQRAGLTPPAPRMLLADPRMKLAAGQLLRNGVIVSAVDRDKGRGMLFHRDAVEEAKRQLSPRLAEGEGLLVTEIGRLLGISRKYSMPLLNYLDETHFTRRIGDRRVLSKPG